MSATCAVCAAPCRGRCYKCNARLCYLHTPSRKGARCQICPPAQQRSYAGYIMPSQHAAAQQKVYYIPSKFAAQAQPQATPKKRFVDMTTDEAQTHIQDLATKLEQMRVRNRAYLDRRAQRGTHTPTDEVMEQDQDMIFEVIEVLEAARKALESS